MACCCNLQDAWHFRLFIWLRQICKGAKAGQCCVQGDPGHPGKESDFDECYFFEPYNASSLPAAS